MPAETSTCWRRPGSSSRRTTGSTTASRRPTTRSRCRWARGTPGTSARCGSAAPGPTRRATTRPSASARRATAASSRHRRPTSTPSRTGGTPRRSTAATPRPCAGCAPDRRRPARARRQALPRRREPLARPRATPSVALSGFTGNWWLGLSLLHTLFTREHNAICDRLRREYPHWPDEQVFGVARLVNSALMAKIHTVEWTPAILRPSRRSRSP